MNKAPKIQSSHVILRLSGKYILQLRDDIPSIAEPGKWSLFGGIMNEGEDPSACIEREVAEELSIEPSGYKELWYEDFYAPYEDQVIRAWFFEAKVDDVWDRHKLNEGEAVKAFDFDELSKLRIPSIMRKTLERYNHEKL